MEKKSEKLKLLVVGLDGATFDVILPLVKEGKLPTLKKIIEEGVYGELESTFPPITGPAWASFMTGKNPGRYGIYGFIDYDPKDYDGFVKGGLVTSNSFAGSTFIDLLSSHEWKIGVVSLPMTYPPWTINGIMISGYPCPNTDRIYYYSSDPKIEVKEKLEYSREQYKSERRKISDGLFMMKKRSRIAIELVKRMKLDCLILVFGATDRVQHFYGVSSDNPIVAKHYQVADAQISKLLDLTDKSTRSFILSDHGAEPYPEVIFNTNCWLKEQGLLTLNEKKAKAFTLFRHLYYGYTHFVESVSKKFRSILEIGNKIKELLFRSSGVYATSINWRKTKAFRYPMPCTRIEGIVINVNGRQENGIVDANEEYEKLRDEIIERLKNLKDPNNGKRVVKECYKREKIYHGKFLEKAPDIVLYLNKHFVAADGFSDVFVIASLKDQRIVHSMKGVVIAKGPMMKRREWIEGASIVDLAPSILYSMGVSIPKSMDGVILKDMFTDEFNLKTTPKYHFGEITTKPEYDHKLTEKEKEEIKERLRALGYL